MKKKLIRRLRILFVLVFCLSALIGGLVYYAYQFSFTLSPTVLNRLKDLAGASINLDFNVGKAKFNVGGHTLKIEDLQLMIPGHEPFLKAARVNVFLASGTGVLDYYYARAAIERIEFFDLTLDTRHERPRPAKDGKNPLAVIPVSQLEIEGLNLQTETSCLTFNDFRAKLVKDSANANIVASVDKGPFGSEASLKAMIDLYGKDSMVRFAWKHKNLALFTPLALFKHFYGVALGNGSLDVNLEWAGDIVSRIEEPSQNLLRLFNEELQGKVVLSTSDFAWAGFGGSLNVSAKREPKKNWSFSLENKNRETAVKLKAFWLGDEQSLSKFKADYSGKNLKIDQQFLKVLKLELPDLKSGMLDFDGNVMGADNRFVGSGSIIASGWSVKNVAINKGQIDWQLKEKNQQLLLEGLFDTDSGQGHASASFLLAEKGRGVIEGNLLEIDLKRFRHLVNFDLKGLGSGFFRVEADLENPASSSYAVDFDLENSCFFSFCPVAIRGRVSGTGRNWLVQNPSAEFDNGGQIFINGTLSPDSLSAQAIIENVDLRHFAVPERIVGGEASLKADLSGSFARPEVHGEIWGSGLSIFRRDISSVKAQLALKDQVLDLSPIVIVPENQGMIDGYYSFSIENGNTRSFKLNFQQLDLNFIRGFFPEGYAEEKITGKVAGSISFNNNQNENYWDFLIDGRSLSIFEEEIDTVYLEGSILGTQGEIRNLFLRTAGGKLNLSGQVLGGDRFDGSVEAESIRLEKVAFLNRLIPGLRGQIDFQGSIEWEGAEKKGYFTLFGDKIMVKDRDLGNLGAEVMVNNKGMKILQAEFDRLGVSLEGSVDWQGQKPYQAELLLKNVDLSFLTQAHGITAFDYGGLAVDGQCSISGTIASLTPDVVEMQLASIKIQKENDVIVSNQPMQLKYQNNSFEVRSLELKYRQGILGVEGVFKPDQKTALVFTGRDFSLRALGRLLDLPEWDYEGSLSANATVFGTYPELKLRADANIANFEIADKKIDGLSARISGDTKQLQLEELKVVLPSSCFEMKGRVEHKDFSELTKLDLDLTIPKGPISDLPGFLPTIFRQASGTIEAELKLAGDPEQPKISGELKLSADELGVSGMRKPFKNLKFEVSTDDSIINIDQMVANLGKGQIRGEGNINFRDGPGSITAKIEGQKLDFSFLNFELEKASASFDIAGNLYNPVVRGDVLVPRGKFHISTDLLKDRPGLNLFFNSLNYHINVNVPRNFWLKSSFLNAEMKGRFSVMGDLEKVNLDGGISCVQGWLFFQRRKFRIDTGEVRFGGFEDTFDPHVYIKSEGQVQSTQVYLTLQGRVSSLTPKIYSSPPMSEGDILALLTLGRDMNSAMQSDSRELFESEILEGLKNSYISSLIGGTISAALNLDELFLTSLYDKTEGRSRSFVRAGKYIGRNIFMAYEGTLDEREEETFIFEYRLPKGFVVNLEFEEPLKDKRIGVRYDWKFW